MNSIARLCCTLASTCCVICICAPFASSQMDMASHSTMVMKEIPPPGKLPVPVKMNGLGNSHITIKATPPRHRCGSIRG